MTVSQLSLEKNKEQKRNGPQAAEHRAALPGTTVAVEGAESLNLRVGQQLAAPAAKTAVKSTTLLI
jgi:hypothetical protein